MTMNVATLTTSDRSLLNAVRGTLDGADQALLCVAFVQHFTHTHTHSLTHFSARQN